MQAIVNNLLTTYTLSGKGRLILLLHGWGDSAKGLAELQTAFGKHYQVLAVDLPGFGATEAPQTTWNLDNYAEFLRALLDKLKLPQPYGVIGHSNGGALAIRAIGLDYLQPEKLVLLAASGVRNSQTGKRFILKIIAKAGKVATYGLPERYRRALRESLYGVAGSDMLVAPHLEETFKKTVRQDVQADARRVAIPTLLIYAADDAAIPLADAHRYQHLMKQARLEVIEDAGHFIHHDQPAKVISLIEGFLQ